MLRRYAPLLGVCAILALVGGLYGPFLHNPRMFDDWTFFSGQNFAYYATHPFGLVLRAPPLFSLALTEVLVGGMAAHRLVNLAFHLACTYAIYRLAYELLRASSGDAGVAAEARGGGGENARVPTAAFAAAAVFALHPVAVYGAGYLMQRTIIFATLFSILSVILFVRGLRRRSHADALLAALMYALAVLSKEHSVLLPAVAVLALPLVPGERRFALRHAAFYLIACAPAALFVFALSRWLVGHAYEPNVDLMASEMGSSLAHGVKETPWGMSVVTQAGLFFHYIGLWIWPRTSAMSIDLRIDFFSGWSAGWIALKLAAYAGFGVSGLALLLRRGRAGIFGWGMLWAWVLFLVEFSTARFQEPFVLYRSYLWAPGLMVALAAPLSRLRGRTTLVALVLVCPLLFYQAHDRLASFSSLLRLWQDAVAKLPDQAVLGGPRTLFNLATEEVSAGHTAQAADIARRCMAQYPDTFYCHTTYGMLYDRTKQYAKALPHLERAAELNPNSGIVQFRVGVVLQSMGRIGEARARYHRALDLGFGGAGLVLKSLETSSAGGSTGRAQGTAGREAASGDR